MTLGESGVSVIGALIADSLPVELEKILVKEGISVTNKRDISKI
jgi:hypothetical protein